MNNRCPKRGSPREEGWKVRLQLRARRHAAKAEVIAAGVHFPCAARKGRDNLTVPAVPGSSQTPVDFGFGQRDAQAEDRAVTFRRDSQCDEQRARNHGPAHADLLLTGVQEQILHTKFFVGTGFSDNQRNNPPPVGSTITFRYQELTDGGVPRFPSFVRMHTGQPQPVAKATKVKRGR